MIDVDWKPSDRKLRQFGLASLAGFPLIGFLLTKLLRWAGVAAFQGPDAPNLVLAGAVAGLLVCLAGWIYPRAILPVYVGLVALALPIGLALSFILIPLIYYGVFTPVALGLRLMGKDPLDREFGRRESYWLERPPAPAPARYYKQY